MPKSFERYVEENGLQSDVLRDLEILKPWELEERYPYNYYPTINEWGERHQKESPQIHVADGETIRTPWIREYMEAHDRLTAEVATAKAKLEDMRKRNNYLEEVIRDRDVIEKRELLETLPLLRI